jgi:hypothetical protein
MLVSNYGVLSNYRRPNWQENEGFDHGVVGLMEKITSTLKKSGMMHVMFVIDGLVDHSLPLVTPMPGWRH